MKLAFLYILRSHDHILCSHLIQSIIRRNWYETSPTPLNLRNKILRSDSNNKCRPQQWGEKSGHRECPLLLHQHLWRHQLPLSETRKGSVRHEDDLERKSFLHTNTGDIILTKQRKIVKLYGLKLVKRKLFYWKITVCEEGCLKNTTFGKLIRESREDDKCASQSVNGWHRKKGVNLHLFQKEVN